MNLAPRGKKVRSANVKTAGATVCAGSIGFYETPEGYSNYD